MVSYELHGLHSQVQRRLYTVEPKTAAEAALQEATARSEKASRSESSASNPSAAVSETLKPSFDVVTVPETWVCNRAAPENSDSTSGHSLIPGARETHNADNSHLFKGNISRSTLLVSALRYRRTRTRAKVFACCCSAACEMSFLLLVLSGLGNNGANSNHTGKLANSSPRKMVYVSYTADRKPVYNDINWEILRDALRWQSENVGASGNVLKFNDNCVNLTAASTMSVSLALKVCDEVNIEALKKLAVQDVLVVSMGHDLPP